MIDTAGRLQKPRRDLSERAGQDRPRQSAERTRRAAPRCWWHDATNGTERDQSGEGVVRKFGPCPAVMTNARIGTPRAVCLVAAGGRSAADSMHGVGEQDRTICNPLIRSEFADALTGVDRA